MYHVFKNVSFADILCITYSKMSALQTFYVSRIQIQATASAIINHFRCGSLFCIIIYYYNFHFILNKLHFINILYESTPLQAYSSQLFTVLGNGITSRILPIPVRYITQRSNPSPKPACLAEPYFLRSR